MAAELARELPNLKTFITLSPLPGFARWLREEAARPHSAVDTPTRDLLERLDADRDFLTDPALAKAAELALMPLAAHYLTVARDEKGRVTDPVARFHLGNGARLEQIDFGADPSERGIKQSLGLMVNYRYVLPDVEKNHEAFVGEGKVIATAAITKLARAIKVAERPPSDAPRQLAPPKPKEPAEG